MYKQYKKSNSGYEVNNNMNCNSEPYMPMHKQCGCEKPENNCEECYQYENMAKHKRNYAKQLQEQARKMQMEADALMREAHMLMCKAEECFKHYHCDHECNQNHGCNSKNECYNNYECNNQNKCTCGCKFEWECTCKPKRHC